MEKHKPKYIDAEGVMRACYDSFLKTGNKAYSEIIALADAVPAADVVEVVRCRECKHYAPIDPSLPTICEYMTGEVVGDNYCSYGERRNE